MPPNVPTLLTTLQAVRAMLPGNDVAEAPESQTSLPDSTGEFPFSDFLEEEGIEQLLFEVDGAIVAYAECSYEVIGSDNWINPRYFEKRDMRPLFVDELAVHPQMHGRGVGSFVLEQLHHLARVHGLNHLVLEVAENNERALDWYKKRSFKKLDAAIFMACPVDLEPELLPPRELPPARDEAATESTEGEPSSE